MTARLGCATGECANLNHSSTYWKNKLPSEENPHDLKNLLSNYFDREFYRAQLAEQLSDDIDAFDHFMHLGWKQGYNPSPTFDINFYLGQIPELKESGVNPLVHYVAIGKDQGIPTSSQSPSGFSLPTEKNIVDLIRPHFDIAYYLARYPDVEDEGIDPVLHYVRYGAKELRDPNEWFSTSLYNKLNEKSAPSENAFFNHIFGGGKIAARLQASFPFIADPFLAADEKFLRNLLNIRAEHIPDSVEWQFVITSFEPLQKVTGGIGTYIRLLLPHLALEDRKILVLVRNDADINNFDQIPGIKLVNVNGFADYFGTHTFVGDEHDRFSLDVFYFLGCLCRTGHQLGLVEFSDYGIDGYFSLKGEELGIVSWHAACIRLHSPELMLFEDNSIPPVRMSTFRRNRLDRELYCYEQSDYLLYGGIEMKKRIENLCQTFGLDVSSKMQWVPHPWNSDLYRDSKASDENQSMARQVLKLLLKGIGPDDVTDGKHLIAFIGRIEDRKGQYQFVDWIISSRELVEFIKENKLLFVFFGKNVLDDIGNFRLEDLYQRLWDQGLLENFVFLGNLDQELLNIVSFAIDGFVFPSIFENYPNALLEVLPTCRPVLVSTSGCMAEMTNGMSLVHTFDPLERSEEHIYGFFNAVLSGTHSKARLIEFKKRRKASLHNNTSLVARYGSLIEDSHSAAVEDKEVVAQPITFIMPIFENFQFLDEALSSIKRCFQPGDEIIVSDDGSSAQASTAISRICAAQNVKLVRLPRNEGPNSARLLGAKIARNDLLQFCDGDDLLESNGIAHCRRYLTENSQIACAYGMMRCFGDENHVWVPRDGHIWTASDENFAHSGLMIRREVALTVLSTVRRPILEDWETNLNIIFSGYHARMLPVVTYHYRREGATRSTRGEAQHNQIRQEIVAAAAQRMPRIPSADVRRVSDHYKMLLSNS